MLDFFTSKSKAHIAWVLGTRPEIIKFSPYLDVFLEKFDLTIIKTGQHYDNNLENDLLEQLSYNKKIEIQSLEGDWNLNTSYKQLVKKIKSLKVDAICVLGDTDSARMGAEVAQELSKKLFHFEAGCRSGNMGQVEESNRIAIDRMSTFFVAPDNVAADFLKKEKIVSDKNIDNLFIAEGMGFLAVLNSNMKLDFFRALSEKTVQKMADKVKKKSIFCTIHRRENLQNPEYLQAMIVKLNELSLKYQINFSLHPHTAKCLENFELSLPAATNVMEPLAYFDCLAQMKTSDLIITDSGGIQEEAFVFGVPIIVARQETEWTRLLAYHGFILKSFLDGNFLSHAEQLIALKREDLLEDRKPLIDLAQGLQNKIIDFISEKI